MTLVFDWTLVLVSHGILTPVSKNTTTTRAAMAIARAPIPAISAATVSFDLRMLHIVSHCMAGNCTATPKVRDNTAKLR